MVYFNSYQQKYKALVPSWLFEERHRKTIYIRIPFYHSNEHYAFKFREKEKYYFVIIWKTRNIRTPSNLKDKTRHISSVVYDEKCTCGENYIGETGRNVTIIWNEHSGMCKNSEPAEHLYQSPEHSFNLKIFRRVPNKVRQRRFMKDITLCVYALPLIINWSEPLLEIIQNGVT